MKKVEEVKTVQLPEVAADPRVISSEEQVWIQEQREQRALQNERENAYFQEQLEERKDHLSLQVLNLANDTHTTELKELAAAHIKKRLG